jgi:hypothetical protein
MRDDQELTLKSKAHPEFFREPPQGGAARTDCTLESFYRVMGSTARPGRRSSQRSRTGKQQPEAPSDRGTKAEIDDPLPCLLITYLLMQLFGTRNLGDISPADKLRLYKVIRLLHNRDGFKNAMMVDTSRNQWHIWLDLLLAMGCWPATLNLRP